LKPPNFTCEQQGELGELGKLPAVQGPWHNAAALGLLQAPSPATAPGAAAAPAPVPMAMAPVPAPMAAVPVPVPAPAPPPFEAEGKPGEMLGTQMAGRQALRS